MDELKATPPPDEVRHVWEWFSELFAGEVLSFSEIRAWRDLTKVIVQPYEVRWLRSMSISWVNELKNG